MVCVVLIVVLAVVGLWGYLGRRWDGKTRFTVIEFSNDVIVRSIDPVTKDAIELTLPGNLEVESVGGRGAWRVGVISRAGSGLWAADSVFDYLGIPYTGVWNHLGWWDQLMWRRLSSEAAWREIDLGKSGWVTTQKTPDGLENLKITENWYSQTREWFRDQTVSSAVLGVKIVNTTPSSGLGANATRVVESLGYKVRELTNSDQPVDRCVVESQATDKKTVGVTKLLDMFDCEWRVGEDLDIVLILGTAYRDWKWGKVN